MKIVLEKGTGKSKITYRAQPEKAKSINEIIEHYNMMVAFFDRLFKQPIEAIKKDTQIKEWNSIKSMKKYFEEAILQYKKLHFVEQEVEITIDPSKLQQDEEECWRDTEELYIILKKKMPIRINTKLTEIKTNDLKINQQKENIKVGTALDVTFIKRKEFYLWGETVEIYTSNLLTNANLPEKATCTWVTKTVAEKDSNGNIHYVTKLADAYKVSGDTFYTQNEKSVLPLGTLTVEETKAPDGYLLDGAYMKAGDNTEQIKGIYLTQITEDGELAVLSRSNQYSVSDQVIRGGVKIQKRDMETKDTKAQGSATLKDAAFAIISLNENPVLVEGKLYKKNETVKTIQTGIDGVATTSTDLLPYGKYKLEETKAPEGYLTDGAKAIEFSITENGKIVDLTDESHSIYNQIKRGDLEGVKIGASTHKRLVNVPFKITSKTTGESHIVAILVLSAAGITGVRIWNKKKQVKRLGIEEKKEEEE